MGATPQLAELPLSATEEDIWLSRSRWYALFASVFAAPYSAAALRRVLGMPFGPTLQWLDPGGGLAVLWREMLAAGQALDQEGAAARLYAEFDRLFLVPVQGEMVSLAASSYLAPEQQRDERRVWFEQLYAGINFDWRASLAASPDIGVWPTEPEHATLILATLAIICRDIGEHPDDAATCADLREIVHEVAAKSGNWLESCLTAIAERTREPFYRFFAEAAAAFLRADQRCWDETPLVEDQLLIGTAGKAGRDA